MASIFQPTLVIGLGGTGKNIILSLKKMIAENSPGGMADYPFLRMLVIDTDVAVPANNSSIQTISQSELSLDEQKEVFSLKADFNIVPDLDNFPQIKDWFPPSLKHNLTPAELEKGAGQKKPIGRFTFAWNAQGIFERLHNLLANPVAIGDAKDWGVGRNLSGFTNVFICGSLCGGTSAGTFLDVAYLVRYIASTLSNRQIYTYGLLATATLFDGIQGDAQIKPNCYASLVELDHFMNEMTYTNEYREFYPAYKNYTPDYKKSAATPPFDFPFLFDKTNREGFSFNSPAAFSEMAARFIYLLTGHEVSKDWQSMDNNVRKNLETTYEKKVLQKSIQYRSMGAFSVLFPKRMVTQLCAYKMTGEYFKIALNDSYAPQEIQNVAQRFLNDIKLNPASEQLEARFDLFRDSEATVRFVEYFENQKQFFLDEEHDKKELIKSLLVWKEDMEKKVGEFRQLNSITPRQVREEFLTQLKERQSLWLDLKLRPDDANKDVNGQSRMSRGSLKRVDKILETLRTQFLDASERYRKKEEESAALVQNTKSDIEAALSDLENSIKSLIPNAGKIKSQTEAVLDRIIDNLNAHRMSLISGWIRQLMTGILENNIPKYEGLIKEVENLGKISRRGVVEFEGLSQKVDDFLEKNRRYEPNLLSDVIFDFAQDVEGTYKKLLADKGEDFILETLSDKLKALSFGPAYEKLKDMVSQIILKSILAPSEGFFFDEVSKISIEDKLMNSPTHLNLMSNGNYMKNASVFLGLDGGELSRVNINLDNSTFFAITIPDNYTGKPCASMKGSLNVITGRKICPMEADPDKFKDEPCSKYDKCLKQVVLRNAPQNLAVIPTSELSEINIITTIAGYPLHAVTSVVHNCRPLYQQLKAKLDAESKEKGLQEERLHMLGPIQFTDLLDRSEDPRGGMRNFRKLLLAALCARRLKIQPLAVSFVTKRDIDTGRKDQPSLLLGKNFDEIFRRYQSTRTEDRKALSDFQTEIEFVLKAIESKEEPRKTFIEMVKETFKEISQNLPPGLVVDDLELLDEFAKETLKMELIVRNADDDSRLFG